MERFAFKKYVLTKEDLCRAISKKIDGIASHKSRYQTYSGGDSTMGDKTFTITLTMLDGVSAPNDNDLTTRIQDALLAEFSEVADVQVSPDNSKDTSDMLSGDLNHKQAEDKLHQEAMAKARKMPDSALDPIKQYSSEETKFWFKYELALDEISRRDK
jgi:hypothetical protein